jgi:2-keto-4-pentenoate hydratase/2-oxohepta-3-ene-1,7-dioic acid hydratase in catechol pathway
MYLVSYVRRGDKTPRMGAWLGRDPAGTRSEPPGEAEGLVLDLAAYGRARRATVPADVRTALEVRALPALRRLVKEFRGQYRTAQARARRFLVSSTAIRFRPPVADPGKIVCIGKNYIDHCKEGNAALPKAPVIFSKFRTSIIGHGDAIELPRASLKVDYEAELAVVIGRGGRHIAEKDALRHVAGYLCVNDVSARDLQAADGQWVRAKGCDTFCPCGPALVTADEIKDPQDLGVRLILNGAVMQDARTSQMTFAVAHLIAFVSEAISWEPGDLLVTGTPSGVGIFRDPPVLLAAGDEVKVAIEKVGTLVNTVVEEKGRVAGTAERMGRVFS